MEVLWKQLKNVGKIPPQRSSHSVSAVGSTIFVFGGEQSPRVPIDNDLYSYELEVESWSIVKSSGSPPCPRIAHAASVVDKCIYIFGGRTGIGMDEGSMNDLHCFNTTTSAWSKVVGQGDIPEPCSYHSMVSQGQKLYVFGGVGEKGRLNLLYSFDVPSSTWKKLPTCDSIAGRGGPGLAVTDKSVYVFAGFAGEESNDMYRFDIDSNVWTTLNPCPNFPRRSVFGSAILKEKIFVFGGEVDPSDLGHAGAGMFSNELYSFDIHHEENGWQNVKAEGMPPSERGWYNATTVGNNKMVIFGGNAPDNSRLNDIHSLEIN